MSGIILTGKNLQKSYGVVHVLKGVDVEVQEGEMLAITGPSGAGKSTLLHILGTIERPDTGVVTIGGTELTTLNDRRQAAFRNTSLGFVFQFHHLLPEFTAIENVCIPAFIRRTSPVDARKRAVELLDLLGLSGRADHKPAEMSGGEQQRVAVARALMNDPALVLADEPSGNLDSHSAGELHALFFTLREKLGKTFIIVTHNPTLAGMADRRIEMQDGYILNGRD